MPARAEKVVVNPENFVVKRRDLVLGFPNQVPLWAKATGRKTIFASLSCACLSTELTFQKSGRHFAEVMHQPGQADMVVESLGTPLR